MHIGDLIRLKRKSHRLTQYKLSEILFISTYKICRLEKNPSIILKFNLDELNKLSDILDIDINLLIKEKQKLSNK